MHLMRSSQNTKMFSFDSHMAYNGTLQPEALTTSILPRRWPKIPEEDYLGEDSSKISHTCSLSSVPLSQARPHQVCEHDMFCACGLSSFQPFNKLPVLMKKNMRRVPRLQLCSPLQDQSYHLDRYSHPPTRIQVPSKEKNHPSHHMARQDGTKMTR